MIMHAAISTLIVIGAIAFVWTFLIFVVGAFSRGQTEKEVNVTCGVGCLGFLACVVAAIGAIFFAWFA